MKLFARLFLIAGIAFLSIALYLLWERNDTSRLVNHAYTYTKSEKQLIQTKNLPTNISIADIGVNLQVIPATIKDEKWQTTKDGVSYLTSSPIPGQEGNSVIYGHNWGNIFGKLPNIKPGNVIEIAYADGTKKKFSVAYTLEVYPGDKSILNKSTDKRLTLYTCTGFLDSKRFVAVAIETN